MLKYSNKIRKITPNGREEYLKKYQNDFRVLLIAKGETLSKNPKKLEPLGFVIIEDVIRKEAKKTLDYFKESKKYNAVQIMFHSFSFNGSERWRGKRGFIARW